MTTLTFPEFTLNNIPTFEPGDEILSFDSSNPLYFVTSNIGTERIARDTLAISVLRAYRFPAKHVPHFLHYTWAPTEDFSQMIGTLLPAQNQDIMDLHNDQFYLTRDTWRMLSHSFRNEAETDQHRLEALRNCYQLDIIHWIYENYSQLQSRVAFENMGTVPNMVRQISNIMAEQFITYNKTSGLYALHPNYTTIAKAEMTRGKLKGRLEHDKTLAEPKLKWNSTPYDFAQAFMTPPPPTLTVYASSINNRGGTPITTEIVAINTRPSFGSIRWEQKVGSIWSPIAGATEDTYTPPTTQDITVRAVATGYLDLDGEVITDTPSNELSIQR